jgi:hypothetical protein|tara:strand:+ start:329 stop:1126 length:798 start_codon:yes stop_codon:yes gene_type:complete
MKILIPFSGGINSTYSLYRWLTETEDQVVVRTAVDQWYDDKHNDIELDRVRQIVLYLKSTIRDFEFELTEWPSNYVKEEHPIRPGFKLGMWDVGKVRPRYEGFYQWIKETNVDRFSFGLSLENTAMDCGYNTLRSIVEQNDADIYLGGMPDLTPVAKGDDFDWDYISSKMIGRFEQFEFLPKELRYMTIKCKMNNLTSCVDTKCRDCAYQRTYEKWVDEGKTGRDFDLYCAKQGSYGPWRHEADPETYLYRGRGKDGKLPYLLYE